MVTTARLVALGFGLFLLPLYSVSAGADGHAAVQAVLLLAGGVLVAEVADELLERRPW